MDKNEVESVKKRCLCAGIKFDDNRIIADTFRNTDILISDYSSILRFFLAMNKPVIYCYTDYKANAEFLSLHNAMYISTSWESLEKHLTNLIEGNDYLEDRRGSLVNEILLSKKDIASEMCNILYKDCFE